MQTTVRERALDVLCGPELAHVVELVAYRDGDSVVVANAAGSARLGAGLASGEVEVLWGRNPVALQDPLAFSPLAAELADPSPPPARNSYPLAAERLASLFADPRAPDLAVVHSGRHHWAERGGHLGEHGSLDVVQSRAPFLLSGSGVSSRGILYEAARVVDVGPTLGWLAGAPLPLGLDGRTLDSLADPGAARHVVGLLWDGCNSNALLALAASGELPAVARLLARGCGLAGGAIAEFPSVTLVNHTSALTGLGPGRHGIVHNEFYDAATQQRVIANEARAWHHAMRWLRPGASTVFQWLGGEGTACVNEPVDSGAEYSTFDLIRGSGHSDGAASLRSSLPDPLQDAHATRAFVAADPDYAWSTQVDASGLEQVLGLWRSACEAPRLTWWNTTLTDTGHHNGGPHSPCARAAMADADRRLGVFLDRLDEIGAFEDTVFLLTADHGSEGADPTCVGDWDEALRAAGVQFRDEAYGFIYLGA